VVWVAGWAPSLNTALLFFGRLLRWHPGFIPLWGLDGPDLVAAPFPLAGGASHYFAFAASLACTVVRPALRGAPCARSCCQLGFDETIVRCLSFSFSRLAFSFLARLGSGFAASALGCSIASLYMPSGRIGIRARHVNDATRNPSDIRIREWCGKYAFWRWAPPIATRDTWHDMARKNAASVVMPLRPVCQQFQRNKLKQIIHPVALSPGCASSIPQSRLRRPPSLLVLAPVLVLAADGEVEDGPPLLPSPSALPSSGAL
jgi:hypothetical protein